MGLMSKLFGGSGPAATNRLIRKLRQTEECRIAAVAEQEAIRERNPFVGRMGIMLGVGPAPGGFQQAVQPGEMEHSALCKTISDCEEREAGLKAKLKQVTGQDLTTASEWEAWSSAQGQQQAAPPKGAQ
jgi:hypothetical protein